MVSKIQEFQVRFMEIIDDMVDDIPEPKYVDLCKELKDNYEYFEEIQNEVEKYKKEQFFFERFSRCASCIMNTLELDDIFKEALLKEGLGEDYAIDLDEVKRIIKNLKCNCGACGTSTDDYETKYNELVNRIKNTSKNQLQKLKNEL